MPLRVSGRNISIGTALQRKITDRVEEATSKYFRGGYSGHATVGRDGVGFRTECILHLDSGALLEAEGMAPNAYDSAELAPRGVPAARAYAGIAPSAPHALHMPSHIFTRVGYWKESISSNRASADAAMARPSV